MALLAPSRVALATPASGTGEVWAGANPTTASDSFVCAQSMLYNSPSSYQAGWWANKGPRYQIIRQIETQSLWSRG